MGLHKEIFVGYTFLFAEQLTEICPQHSSTKWDEPPSKLVYD